MKQDWTDIIKDKMAQSEITPPDDLWAAISSDLDQVLPAAKPVRKIFPWKRAWIAACAALSIGAVLYISTRGVDGAPEQIMLADANDATKQSETNTVAEIKAEAIAKTTPIHLRGLLTHRQPTQVEAINATAMAQSAEEAKPETVDADKNAPAVECPDTAWVAPNETDKNTIFARELVADDWKYAQTADRKSNKRASISFFASGMSSSSTANANDYVNVLPPYEINGVDPGDGDDGSQASKMKSRGAPSASSAYLLDARHKTPLKFGATLRYPLSRSVGLNAGVTYSRLSSQLTWMADDAHVFETEQTLHYIGIPVSVDYLLPAYRSVSFYLTAGALAEKCIDGSYRLSNAAVSKSVSEKAVQFSVFAGAGVQFNFTPHIGIYVEPLATYYFNNHSQIVNIYKDRRFNLDLRLGLRFTL